MENIKEIMASAQNAIAKKLKELDELEKEKKEILNAIRNAKEGEDFSVHAKKMEESEQKFKKLLDEMTEINNKVQN